MKLLQMFDLRAKYAYLAIPQNRMNRLGHAYQRRLGDHLKDVFHRACIEGDARTADGLYAVLEDLYTRRIQEKTSERRIHDDALTKARAALQLCRRLAQPGVRSKPPVTAETSAT